MPFAMWLLIAYFYNRGWLRTLDLPTAPNSLSGYLVRALYHVVICVLFVSCLGGWVGTYPAHSHCTKFWVPVGAVLSHVIVLVSRSHAGKEYFATAQRETPSLCRVSAIMCLGKKKIPLEIPQYGCSSAVDMGLHWES